VPLASGLELKSATKPPHRGACGSACGRPARGERAYRYGTASTMLRIAPSDSIAAIPTQLGRTEEA